MSEECHFQFLPLNELCLPMIVEEVTPNVELDPMILDSHEAKSDNMMMMEDLELNISDEGSITLMEEEEEGEEMHDDDSSMSCSSSTKNESESMMLEEEEVQSDGHPNTPTYQQEFMMQADEWNCTNTASNEQNRITNNWSSHLSSFHETYSMDLDVIWSTWRSVETSKQNLRTYEKTAKNIGRASRILERTVGKLENFAYWKQKSTVDRLRRIISQLRKLRREIQVRPGFNNHASHAWEI